MYGNVIWKYEVKIGCFPHCRGGIDNNYKKTIKYVLQVARIKTKE
jgi:hypothetical protein